jgi:hypothetical protein
MRHPISSLMLSLVLTCVALGAAAADQLITEAEAALPTSPDSALNIRGITRGPAIEQVAPAPEAKNLKSPLPLKIKFTARNNASIDKDSVKITYLKVPSVDLTARLKAHLTSDGIDMSQAEVPPGTHIIRLDVKDTQGRASTAIIELSVTGK